jgi:hypothetical protein
MSRSLIVLLQFWALFCWLSLTIAIVAALLRGNVW